MVLHQRWEHIICVTNRHLAAEAVGIRDADSEAGRKAFLSQLQRVMDVRPHAVILREKDLDEASYRLLAERVLARCRAAQVPCIFHTYPSVARKLDADGLHLPLPLLRKLSENERQKFSTLGASCHSVDDVLEAQSLGCTYVTAGHIYETTCKPGAPPRGLAFLREAVRGTTLPVYAIGGITYARLSEVLQIGAAGACVMSGCMRGNLAAW
ncbi:thiamine phosphate synthase [uncultured Selenomonas sp.]|uniref:thiamine phosphate synthase n=1 Tax=uncultured Selenomonas sp. TaxID=159275 RepID=UPI0025E6F80A|nr:thiamine phosphate synthase [uncultured Selenomonas sp.]